MEKRKRTTPILPQPLRPGDTVGLCSPAGPIREPGRLQQGIDLLREAGFRIKTVRPPDQYAPEVYLAGPDSERLDELHRLWADDEVKAILAVRGGYGCLRLLPSLDFNFIRTRPKWLIGFSDLTVLLNTFYRETGLITLHGPSAHSLTGLDRDSVERFFTILGGSFPPMQSRELEILKPGRARGKLVGGNLSTLVHLLGTPWEVDLSGRILILEDTGEPPYRLDRMLTQLAMSRGFRELAGLVLGMFDPGHDDRLETLRLQEMVWQRVLELSHDLAFPIWAGLPFGHLDQNQALPIGMEIEMDDLAGRLHFHPGSARQTG
ncbi:S66 peptidase family protein [Desulfolithobacter sp.]